MYYDAHCHFSLLKKAYDGFIIAAVSMDYQSSEETLSLRSDKILAGVGIHPWNVHLEELKRVESLINRADFIGEVGLDYRFAKADKEKQKEYFTFFARKAYELNKLINVHALDAWKDALNILLKEGVRRAIFHWYSGPEDLLKDIEGAGYFITINPSVTFQNKHRRIAERASLEVLLTESDGGYNYRGKLLQPSDIIGLISFLSKLKGVDEAELLKVVERNFRKAFFG